MNKKRSNRDEVRAHSLTVPMTEEEHNVVLTSSKREGMTKTAYCRKVLDAVSHVSLAKLLMLIENEKRNN